MTKVAFTLCSLNYMAQAKTLADSFKQHNPDWHFVIGLVDRVEGRLPDSYWQPHELIEVEELNIEGFKEMCEMYDIVELNTAVKPFYMKYLFERDERVEVVAYFDPDIMFFDKISDLDEKVVQSNIVLTPHMFQPAPEEKFIGLEQLCLWVGVYNLGFIALRRSGVVFKFLEWWMSRLRRFCFRNLENLSTRRGFFVDQVWVNFVPVFFESPALLHEGHNVAYWNLMERNISVNNGRFWVNNCKPLVFFHFSAYEPDKPEKIGKYWSEHFSLKENLALRQLFERYRLQIIENKFTEISKERCLLTGVKKKEKYPKYGSGLFGEIKYRAKILLTKVHRATARYAF